MNNKLVKLRGTRTQEEIANAIGISISAIGMYETGQRVPRDEIKVKLANFYNVSIESLFFDNNVHSEKTRTKYRRVINMNTLCDVYDVMKITKKKKTASYSIIKELNKELKAKGFYTTNGRVSERYLKERLNLL